MMQNRIVRLLFICTLVSTALAAGDWTTRFNLTANRIRSGGPPVLNDEFLLADAVPQHTRRFTEFSGDVSGRYIGAMAMVAQHTGATDAALDRVVTKVLACQKPDGHFGDPMSTEGKVTAADMALLWGNGRMLIGLLEYYNGSKRADVLAASRRLADFFIGVAPALNSEAVRKEFNGEKFAVGYICWTHILEGAVELYRIGRDERYLKLARELAARTDRHPSQHSHGFLTSVRGVVALYRLTGERGYLEQAEREWQGVIDSGNLAQSGAVPEMFAPAAKRDEGCSEADWLRLSLDLWRATRSPKYLDAAERAMFNEFAYNQFHTGDFGHHEFNEDGYSEHFAHAWWCCTFHAMRAMVDLLENVFREQKVLPVQMAFPSLTRLLQPVGTLSPMGVLWTHMGSSPAYEIFTGCAELTGGLLLIIPRTATFGALIGLAAMIQVFMLNMTYDVPAKLLAFHTMLLACFLLAPDVPRLVKFLLLRRTTSLSTEAQLFRGVRANRIALVAQIIFGLWLVGLACHYAWGIWNTRGGGRPLPPLYGIWEVEKMSIDEQPRPPLLTDSTRWRRAIFDYPDRMVVQRPDDIVRSLWRLRQSPGENSRAHEE